MTDTANRRDLLKGAAVAGAATASAAAPAFAQGAAPPPVDPQTR